MHNHNAIDFTHPTCETKSLNFWMQRPINFQGSRLLTSIFGFVRCINYNIDWRFLIHPLSRKACGYTSTGIESSSPAIHPVADRVRYSAGLPRSQAKMKDVTKEFPQVVYQSAADSWQMYTQIRQEYGADAAQGAMAAYVASKFILGQKVDAIERLRQAYSDHSGQEFINKLNSFLGKTGYTR